MEWIQPLLQSAREYQTLLWWLFALSLALLLVTPAAVVWVVVQLPNDYFTVGRRRHARWLKKRPALQPVVLVAKNMLGIVLILAGLIMLVVPGQGLLTLVVGLMLTNFPGKFRLERWLATRPPVWRSINWLRRRAGREPLRRPNEVAMHDQ
jgi:hypothetical protein